MTTATISTTSHTQAASLPRDSRGLDILDRAVYRMTPRVVAVVGGMRGEMVCWQTKFNGWMTGEVLALNVDGTVLIHRTIGGTCQLHWSKIPAIVKAWERKEN